MKRYLPYFLLLFTILGVAVGCKKDDAAERNTSTKLVQDIISGVNGPTTGLVNEELKFSVLWDNADSTQHFHHLQDSAYLNTHIIKLFVSGNTTDTAKVTKQATNIIYTFKPTAAGTYYFKFYKPENSDHSAIIDTVVITK